MRGLKVNGSEEERLPLLTKNTAKMERQSSVSSEPPRRIGQDLEHIKQSRSQSLMTGSPVCYGSSAMTDLLNFDQITLVQKNRRASASGCIVDIGGLASLLSRDDEEATLTGSSEETSTLDGTELTIEHRATYWKLLRYNIPYTLYILSYFSAHAGEWFTYVAQISAVEHISSGSQIAVSILVAIRMIPNIVFASFGGALADAMDRRVSMIALDVTGIFVVLLYLPVLHYKSLGLLFTLAFLQATVAAIYDPVRQAIVPLLVPQEDYLKKATTIAGLAWSLMAAVGASLGGFIASTLGIRMCFMLDSLTYFVSALLMWLVPGKWSVESSATSQQRRASLSLPNVISTYKSMTVEGIEYLIGSSFGLFVTLKASGALSFGSTDVLNVRLSHIEGDESGDSMRLGILFGVMGVGCLIGPLVAEKYIDMKRPRTLLASCIIGYAFISLGFVGIGISSTFASVCVSTGLRGVGSSIMWTHSTLLLQKFAAREMLGRVLSVDYGLCTLMLAVSAFIAGLLEDHAEMTPEQISWVMAVVGFLSFCGWGTYYVIGGGPVGVGDKPLEYDVLS